MEPNFQKWAAGLADNCKTAIKMLFPDGAEHNELLQKLLLRRFVADEDNAEIEIPVDADLNLLAQFIADCTVRQHMDPIFYLQIVREFRQEHWKYEFLLLEIEEQLLVVLNEEERNNWREILRKLNDDMINTLRKRLKTSGEAGTLDKDKFEKILNLLEKVGLNQDDVGILCDLPLDNWYSELRMTFWRSEIHQKLNRIQLTGEEKKEAVFMLLQLENKEGEKICEQIFNDLLENQPVNRWPEMRNILQKNFDSTEEERTEQDLVNTILNKMMQHSKLPESIQNTMALSVNTDDCFKKNNSDVLKSSWLRQILNLSQDSSVMEFLNVYDQIVELKMGFPLRNTQKVAIVTLLKSGANTLFQVSTGEGKSLIVAGVAIGRAKAGQTVDIITSNDVLAKRDSESKLAEIYSAFRIKVGNNCSKKEEKRADGYKCQVVYGQMSNFQRDYLLDTFYGREIRGDRKFDSVIVDEVDCMLLDRGNNVLYLSHDIPGMEMLESLYIFIKEKMKSADDPLAPIKSAVLFELFGQISKDDLQEALSIPKDEIEKIWSHLTQRNVIDQRGRLLIEEENSITEQRIGYNNKHSTGKPLNRKLVFYLRRVAGRERRIRIPFHLLSFVDRHIDTWLDNAAKALDRKKDEDYVVGTDDTDNRSPSSVIIIDPDTGTDLMSSQWGEALHQFLQLKEGCLVTLQSLKSVFISNVTYIKRYTMLAGLTGTLGSKPEREFLQSTYSCDYVTVPTAFPKRFTMKPAIVAKMEGEWLAAIVEEIRQTTVESARSLVVFCESIKEVNKVRERLGKDLKSELDNKKLTIHSYTRDYEKFPFEKRELAVGHIIVATNLAGRGTDIKISKELRQNGGLHICLTYLPDNIRIEEQALGRAGRKGEQGSGILIVRDPSERLRTINELKFERNRRELQRISRLAQNFSDNISKQEKCFRHFFRYFQYLKHTLQANTSLDKQEISCVCNSALDQWALWLDSVDSFESHSLERLLGRMQTFLRSLQLPADTTDIDWMTPGRLIVMAKHLATRKTKPNLSKADAILKKLVKSQDSFFYPAAHYYRAFIVVKESHLKDNESSSKTNKNLYTFKSMLRATEILLREHIAMQKSFLAVIRTDDVDYKRQKENMIGILENYRNSVGSLLGRWCSVAGLIEAGIEATIVNQLLEILAADGVVTCRVNDAIPGRQTVRNVAYNHAISERSLKDFLENYKEKDKFDELTMKDKLAEVKLRNKTSTVMDRCWTRDRFWNFLLENEVFQPDNVVVPEQRELKVYNPRQPRQIARLDADELRGVAFGILEPGDLALININDEEDRRKIWDELKLQNIVDQQGHLSSETQLFNYPVYEAPVRKLIETTFAADKVKRRWLDESDDGRFYAMEDLPIKSDRDLLWDDLLATHIISGARVTDDSDVDLKLAARNAIGKITPNMRTTNRSIRWIRNKLRQLNAAEMEEKKLVNCLVSYLKSCRALYASMETPEAWLRPLQDEGDDANEVISHQNQQLMSLVGFNHVIVLEEQKWSDKMICRAIAIAFIGAAQLAVAVVLLNFQVSPQIAMALIRAGVGDVLFAMRALLTGQHFTWADYGRHKRKQAVKLLAQIAVGIAEEGFILADGVPLEEILETVAEDVLREVTRDHLNNDVDVVCPSRQRVLRILQQEREQVETSQSLPDHIQSCLRLMKRTKDPKLFAIFIRDKVPIDQFCADALGCALSAHLKRKLVIQIENYEQIFDHEKVQNTDVLVVKIDRAVEADDRCLFECVMQQFPEQDSTELRKSLSSTIETDLSVTETIRKVWQSRSLYISLFGSHVTNKTGIQKTDFAVAGIVTHDQCRLNRRDPFQNDYAFIHSAIEDGNKRKIPCNKYPVLSVTYPEVSADDAMRKEEGDFKLFRHIQRGHLERGQYRNAVWNSMETNWMPVAKRINETDIDLRKEHVVTIKNHFKQYSKEGNRKLMDATQAGELTKILNNKIDRLTVGNPACAGPSNP